MKHHVLCQCDEGRVKALVSADHGTVEIATTADGWSERGAYTTPVFTAAKLRCLPYPIPWPLGYSCCQCEYSREVAPEILRGVMRLSLSQNAIQMRGTYK